MFISNHKALVQRGSGDIWGLLKKSQTISFFLDDSIYYLGVLASSGGGWLLTEIGHCLILREREVWFEDSHWERCLVILVRSYQDVIALAEGGVKNRFLIARAERCWFMLGLYPCSTKTMEVLRNKSLVPRDFPRPERLGVEGYIEGCEVEYWISRYLLSFGGLQTLSHNQSYPKGWIKKSIPLGRLV